MENEQHVTVVTDLGYGDAGKGSIVDYLAREAPTGTVVRFNGGAQAAHNVVTPDGRHHTFSQFGAASFVPGVATHLSRFMLVNPLNLVREAAALHAAGVPDPQGRLTIDEDALIVTPYHQAANRLRELARGNGRHGSCGEGIGETMADSLEIPDDMVRARDLACPRAARRKLEVIRNRKLEQIAALRAELSGPLAASNLQTLEDTLLSSIVTDFYLTFAGHVRVVSGDYLGRLLNGPGQVLFEGAQGVLLDEWRGFHPYTTWSTTTFANADRLLSEQRYDGGVTQLGLLRAYATRHGAGPFVTEDAAMTAATPDYHNGTNEWQQDFRVGHFDLVAARYGLEVAGTVDELALTCLDRLPAGPYRVCVAYETPAGRLERLEPGPFTDLDYQERLTGLLLESRPVYETVAGTEEEYVRYLESRLGVPLTLTSHGVTAGDKRRRAPVCV